MPVYKKISKTGKTTWFASFYFTDWTGARKQKKKEGFSSQREAKEYERSFLERIAGTPDMTFDTLIEIYLDDFRHHAKESSVIDREYVIENHLRPFFGKLAINEITPATIRKWQSTYNTEEYAPSYLHRINSILSAILNFAVKFYGLLRNPAKAAGKMGNTKSKEMNFLTLDEFNRLRSVLLADQQYIFVAAYAFLFLTGCRVGEMLALTKEDFDFENNTVAITKTYMRVKSKDVITIPKTEKSNRVITMPPSLVRIIKDYLNGLGQISAKQRIFDCVSNYSLWSKLRRYTKKENLPPVRVHDLRHSHASLLIEQGVSIIAISSRLGHSRPSTTTDTYSHTYPNKQKEIADNLQKVLPF